MPNMGMVDYYKNLLPTFFFWHSLGSTHVCRRTSIDNLWLYEVMEIRCLSAHSRNMSFYKNNREHLSELHVDLGGD